MAVRFGAKRADLRRLPYSIWQHGQTAACAKSVLQIGKGVATGASSEKALRLLFITRFALTHSVQVKAWELGTDLQGFP